MTSFLQFLILGLGTGAMYALSGLGLVLVYKGSGVLNFAQGAIGMVAAYFFNGLAHHHGWPTFPAIVVAVLGGAGISLAVHTFVMRPLRHAPALTKLIATLGITAFLVGATIYIEGGDTQLEASVFGAGTIKVGAINVPTDRLYLLAVAFGLTAILAAVYRFTTFGLATTAVAEDEVGFAGLGRSPDTVAAINWAIGGALAAVAGVLVSPITGLDPVILTMLVVPAMAAALLGGFSSFLITFLAGVAIGVAQSIITSHTTEPGIQTAVPFAVIIALMVLRGRGLPVRGEAGAKLPRLGSGKVRLWQLAVGVPAGLLVIWLVPVNWVSFLTTSLVYSLVLLSIIVLTGFCGQLSLAQYMLAGMSGWIAASLIAYWHLPFELAAICGLIGTVITGVIVGLPALRTRGVNLAVVTLGLAAVIENMIMNNSDVNGDTLGGLNIGVPHLFGINVSSFVYERRYATLAFVVLVVLVIMVANLRRSQAGLQLVAVRSNEKAAASLGINVAGIKLYAFALAAGIAGFCGVLTVYRYEYVSFTNFSSFASMTAVSNAVISGIGYAYGAIIGLLFAPYGLGYLPFSSFQNFAVLLIAFGGILVIPILIKNPSGLASTHSLEALKEWLARRRHPAKRVGLTADTSAVPANTKAARVRPETLEVRNIRVQFGGVVAVDGVSLDVKPGEIHGLIGPNGSGKTTLIDAISGFVRVAGGEVSIGGKSMTGSRAHKRVTNGLTRSFQTLELFEDLTVVENLRAAIPTNRLSFLTSLAWPKILALTPGAAAAVHEFGIGQHLNLKPEELSYGQRRLVAMARATAPLPSIILLDEPSAGLDEVHRREFSTLLQRLAREWGIGALLVEHDVDLVQSICDRLTVIDRGRVIATGKPTDVLNDPDVIAAYLGVASAADLLEREGRMPADTVGATSGETALS
jgi:sulfate-transporting ATPase